MAAAVFKKSVSCRVYLTVLLGLCSVVIKCSLENHFKNVPSSHLPYFLRYHSGEGNEFCHERNSCESLDKKSKHCWGYEQDCHMKERYSNPTCSVHSTLWAKTLEDQTNLFWEQGDFGYIKKKKETVQHLCVPKNEGDSSLICTKNLWYCHATNLYMDLTHLNSLNVNERFREDVFKEGEVGGHCQFKKEFHSEQNENKSPLQSWFAELEHYTALPFRPVEDGKCDVVIDRPTIIIKLDAGVNMYHHFCDFVNLYMSQHMNGSFSTDVNILVWDTSSLYYPDFFSDTWKVFTRHSIIHLDEYDGKRVCFKDAVFSFLARMIFGLYFNMPLVPNCHGSGLFHAFSHHTLHRLGIRQQKHNDNEYRITLLTRNTKFRQILNENELIGAMKNVPMFKVRSVDYNHQMPFLEQLQITHNSDIFIGMHGAGLTHLLFLPDWAVAFELYNTEDPDCYRDLANLRGVCYMTWENKDKLFQQDKGHHPTLGEHAKFTNYAFDVEEFVRLIYKAVDVVREKRATMKPNKDNLTV